MKPLNYLTVQDLLWVNLQILNKVRGFDFARLEEATFYQYAYGESSNLLPQAARFFPGFLKMKPLDEANEATAFVAGLAFLRINEQRLTLKDADGLAWFKQATIAATALDAITGVSHVDEHSHGHGQQGPNIRAAIRSVIDDFPKTIASLAHTTAAA